LVLTGLRGPTSILLQITQMNSDNEDETVVGVMPPMNLPGDDPFTQAEIATQVEGLVLPAEGEYKIKVIWNSEPIATKRLVAQGR